MAEFGSRWNRDTIQAAEESQRALKPELEVAPDGEQWRYRVVYLYGTDYLVDEHHIVVLQANRPPSIEDMKGVAKRFNALDAAIPALKGVAIMLNTELAGYESEPWAKRVRAALALVDGPQER